MRVSWLIALAATLLLLVGEAPAATAARQDVVIPMDDGVPIAGTLYVPDGAPPEGGWPALVFLHGIGGSRQQTNLLVESSGLAGADYVVLTYDIRGHGGSGGLVGIAGPRDVADARAVHAWLAARADVADARVGAAGISYGGGVVMNSLVAGVPWAAVVTVESWTDLHEALLPQGVPKSGVVAGLAAAIPEGRRDPSLAALQAAAIAGNTALVEKWAAARSSLGLLGSVRTPVFIAQGRRDFLFGLDQGTKAFQRLRGPKALYVGLHGHAPSTFPAADSAYLLGEMRSWLDSFLRGTPRTRPNAAVAVAPETFAGPVRWGRTLPRTTATTVALPGVSTFAQRGKAVRRSQPLRRALEVFGSPTVRVPVAASGGWSRLVAVLTARTRAGREILVSSGAAPTAKRSRKVTIRLLSQATFVPAGSRLTLTLASSSTAQSSSNAVYLDLPMPARARVRVGTAVLTVPGLRAPVTR